MEATSTALWRLQYNATRQALPVLVEEILICILRLKFLCTPIANVLKNKNEVVLSVEYFYILMTE